MVEAKVMVFARSRNNRQHLPKSSVSVKHRARVEDYGPCWSDYLCETNLSGCWQDVVAALKSTRHQSELSAKRILTLKGCRSPATYLHFDPFLRPNKNEDIAMLA